jgi:hypothetical protein
MPVPAQLLKVVAADAHGAHLLQSLGVQVGTRQAEEGTINIRRAYWHTIQPSLQVLSPNATQ